MRQVELISRLYMHFDSVAARKIAGQAIECRKGCAHCCGQLIFITPIEAIGLRYELDRLRFNRDTECRKTGLETVNKIIEWLDSFEKWLKEYGVCIDQLIIDSAGSSEPRINKWWRFSSQVAFDFISNKSACPVLDSDNECVLYKLRPVSCRAYWSLDEHSCEIFYTGGRIDIMIPFPPFQTRFRDGLAKQISDLSLESGDTRGVVLPLVVGLADPWRWFRRWSKQGPLGWAEASGEENDWPRDNPSVTD